MAKDVDLSKLRVRDVFDPDHVLAEVLPATTPLDDAVARFAARDELRAIFAVDENDGLVGVLTRYEMLHWASLAFGSLGIRRGLSWGELAHIARATTLQEACARGGVMGATRLDESLEDAFGRMVLGGLIDVPVLDEEGKVLGDLRLTQILHRILQAPAGSGNRQ